jgi:hypothetical protein
VAGALALLESFTEADTGAGCGLTAWDRMIPTPSADNSKPNKIKATPNFKKDFIKFSKLKHA